MSAFRVYNYTFGENVRPIPLGFAGEANSTELCIDVSDVLTATPDATFSIVACLPIHGCYEPHGCIPVGGAPFPLIPDNENKLHYTVGADIMGRAGRVLIEFNANSQTNNSNTKWLLGFDIMPGIHGRPCSVPSDYVYRIIEVGERISAAMEAIQNLPQGPQGANGFTFTPQINGSVLSWTNDGNLPNPPPFDFSTLIPNP